MPASLHLIARASIAIACATLAACGGGSGDSSASTSAAATTSPSTENTASAPPVTGVNSADAGAQAGTTASGDNSESPFPSAVAAAADSLDAPSAQGASASLEPAPVGVTAVATSAAAMPTRTITMVERATTTATASGTGAIYYVDSLAGSDLNNGLSATNSGAGTGPWRTLARLSSANLAPGDNVRLTCGSSWTETLRLASSGAATNPITVAAYPSGCATPPVIDGSTTIPASAWTLHQGNIYRATLASAPNQVMVNATAISVAHHPNVGYDTNLPLSLYLRTAAASDQTTVSGRTVSNYLVAGTDLRLPTGATIGAGTKVRVRTNSWTLDERDISSFASSKLALSSPTSYPVAASWGYFLLGQLWMLDSAGEWHFDATSRQLYAWMPDSLAPGARVATSQLAIGVDLAALKYVTIDNLTVRKIGTGFDLRGSTGVAIKNSRVEDAAKNGVSLAASIDAQLLSNRFDRTGSDAIAGVDNSIGIATGLVASYNLVTDSGVLRNNAGVVTSLPTSGLAAISAGYRATVQFNKITGASYHGIRTSGNSTVTNNVIDSACLTLDDCGGIYVYGTSTQGTTVAGNVISNIVGNLLGKPAGTTVQSEGIYLDDHANGVSVTGNSVTAAETGILLHNAFNNTISGNVLYGNRKHQIWLYEDSKAVQATGDLYGNVITGNQLFPTTPNAALGQQSTIAETARFASFDRNRYSGLMSARVVSEAWPQGSNSFSFAAWQASTTTTGVLRTPDINGSAVNAVGFASFTTLGESIVPNGDISLGNKGWTPWNETAPLASAVAQSCTGRPCLVVTAGGSNSLVATPPFSVVGDKWYRVSFDLRSSLTGQPVSVLVRRGGGGTNGYESLMGSAEMVNAPGSFQRVSFTFKASKTVNAADPATRDIGARLYFDRIQAGSQLVLMNVEIVPVTAADASVKTQLFANTAATTTSYACPESGTTAARCSQYFNFGTGAALTWPLVVAPFTSTIVYTRDTSLIDSDSDGIPDIQDACPATAAGSPVNSRGCAIGQG